MKNKNNSLNAVQSCLELVNKIINTKSVNGLDDNELKSLKLKTVGYINLFSQKIASEKTDRYTVYFNEENPDFGAYFAYRDGKVVLVFRQSGNQTFHNYLSSTSDILEGMKLIDSLPKYNIVKA